MWEYAKSVEVKCKTKKHFVLEKANTQAKSSKRKWESILEKGNELPRETKILTKDPTNLYIEETNSVCQIKK